MNNRQLLLTGMAAGVGAVLVFAALFSTLQDAASAQMMQHQGMGAMGPGMMTSGGATQYNGIFSSTGSSIVNNVKVTGVSVTGASEVSISLRYTGTGSAPSVVIVANTNPTAMMSMMHGSTASGGLAGMGGMMHGYNGYGPSMMYGSQPYLNNTQWQQLQSQMYGYGMSPSMMYGYNGFAGPSWWNSTSIPYSAVMQIGSTAVDAGWKSGTFKVKLQGDGSAYDSEHIMAMVFPLTS